MKKIKSISTLIIMLLIIMAFVRGSFSQLLMIASVSAWLGIVFGSFILRRIIKFAHTVVKLIQLGKQKLLCRIIEIWKEDARENIKKNSFYDIDFSKEKIEELLLLHVSRRITERLQAIYPKATWEWKTENPLSAIKSCGTAQIYTKQTVEFNIAEVVFEPKGSIVFHFFREVSVIEKQNKEAISATWFDSRGQAELTEIIADLYAKGYKSMKIDAVGNVRFRNKILKRLEDFPQKKEWDTLIPKITERTRASAKVCKDSITLSWS